MNSQEESKENTSKDAQEQRLTFAEKKKLAIRKYKEATNKEDIEKTAAIAARFVKIASDTAMLDDLNQLETLKRNIEAFSRFKREKDEGEIIITDVLTRNNIYSFGKNFAELLTPDIKLTDEEGNEHEFGKFIVRFSTAGEEPVMTCRPEKNGNWDGEGRYPHPHVNEERICLGDMESITNKAIQDGRLSDAYECALSVLQSYYPGNPFKKLCKWKKVRCEICEDQLAEFECDCGSNVCENCSDGTNCVACAPTCKNCNETLLGTKQETCETSGCEAKICRACWKQTINETKICGACEIKEQQKSMVTITWKYAEV